MNPGETLGLVFALLGGSDFDDVLNALAGGQLLIGIHVQAFASGGSESFINVAPIPVPAAFLLYGSGLALVGFVGDAVPYGLSWIDKNGVMQTLPPGRAFVADPNTIRSASSEQRRVSLEKASGDLFARDKRSLSPEETEELQRQSEAQWTAGKKRVVEGFKRVGAKAKAEAQVLIEAAQKAPAPYETPSGKAMWPALERPIRP